MYAQTSTRTKATIYGFYFLTVIVPMFYWMIRSYLHNHH